MSHCQLQMAAMLKKSGYPLADIENKRDSCLNAVFLQTVASLCPLSLFTYGQKYHLATQAYNYTDSSLN